MFAGPRTPRAVGILMIGHGSRLHGRERVVWTPAVMQFQTVFAFRRRYGTHAHHIRSTEYAIWPISAGPVLSPQRIISQLASALV
jgi:hypothetical protein